jgi:hypothetical protein
MMAYCKVVTYFCSALQLTSSTNTQVYIWRTCQCGLKNLDVLLNEIEVIATKSSFHGQVQFIQYVLQPAYNFCRELRGLNEQALSPLVVFLSNDELRERSIIETHQGDWQLHVITEIMRSFIFRDTEKAQRMVNECKNNIQRHALMFYHIIMDFYVGLTCCYFARQTGDISQTAAVQQICDKFDGWVSQQEQKVQPTIHTQLKHLYHSALINHLITRCMYLSGYSFTMELPK